MIVSRANLSLSIPIWLLFSGGAQAQTLLDLSLQDMQGTWIQEESGEVLSFGKSEAFDSRYGAARIRNDNEYGSNLDIIYRKDNTHCWYFVTSRLGGDQLNLKLLSSNNPGETCLSGVFRRDATSERLCDERKRGISACHINRASGKLCISSSYMKFLSRYGASKCKYSLYNPSDNGIANAWNLQSFGAIESFDGRNDTCIENQRVYDVRISIDCR